MAFYDENFTVLIPVLVNEQFTIYGIILYCDLIK